MAMVIIAMYEYGGFTFLSSESDSLGVAGALLSCPPTWSLSSPISSSKESSFEADESAGDITPSSSSTSSSTIGLG